MFKHFTVIIAATLLTLATGSASGQPPLDLVNLLQPKTIFVTSTTHTGNLGGLAGADEICQDLATSPESIVPEGGYVALLSTDDVNASARITPSSGPYIRPDGAPVAANWAELFAAPAAGVTESIDRNLINFPGIDERGGLALRGTVWTGTTNNGTPAANNCLGWTSEDNTELGSGGDPFALTGAWLDFFTPACDAYLQFYCVQR